MKCMFMFPNLVPRTGQPLKELLIPQQINSYNFQIFDTVIGNTDIF